MENSTGKKVCQLLTDGKKWVWREKNFTHDTNMAEELLTLKEIAKRLDLPESNIRYYRDRFEQYLPYTGEGRKRRYRLEAIDVFDYIATQLKQNSSCEEITDGLSKRFSQNPQIPSAVPLEKTPREDATPSADFSRLFESQARALEHLSEILHHKESQDKEIQHLRFGYQNVKRALVSLWNKNKALEAGKVQSAQEELHVLRERISNLESRQSLLENVILKQSRMIKHLHLQQKATGKNTASNQG